MQAPEAVSLAGAQCQEQDGSESQSEGAWTPRRSEDGWVPIEDYGFLGDGRSVALVASDGQIDWWPIPALDSPPICAAVLDPLTGGHISLRPVGDYQVRRQYLEGTNVLQTTFFCAGGGVVEVIDALNVGRAGPLPWTELARRVRVISGPAHLRWEVRPGDRFGRASPWAHRYGDAVLISLGDQEAAVLAFELGDADVSTHSASGEVVLDTGKLALLAVVATDDEPLPIPGRHDVEDRLDHTVRYWQRWSSQLHGFGRWDSQVCRSALALDLLLHQPTGAIAAAPTTSLPEAIGGKKNYDYRYSWVRDSSFTVDALLSLGLQEEVHAAVSWLLDAVGRTQPVLKVFYKLDGSVPDEQGQLEAAGYRGTRPVNIGNSATNQRQLGTFGDFFDTVGRYVDHGHILDAAHARLLAGLADRCCDRWREKDSGIWELPSRQHYTISKIGCWVALDRASRLADQGFLPHGHRERWISERDEIKGWVDQHCWSPAKSSYTFHADTEDLDAAVLLAGRTGFERGERLASSIEAVIAELGEGPWIYRYTGMKQEENSFVACAFWVVDALAWCGQTERASALMDRLLASSNDLGLYAEQLDPATGTFLGNFPQGLSMLALINAARDLARADGAAQSSPAGDSQSSPAGDSQSSPAGASQSSPAVD